MLLLPSTWSEGKSDRRYKAAETSHPSQEGRDRRPSMAIKDRVRLILVVTLNYYPRDEMFPLLCSSKYRLRTLAQDGRRCIAAGTQEWRWGGRAVSIT
jgi:hypothetical protein